MTEHIHLRYHNHQLVHLRHDRVLHHHLPQHEHHHFDLAFYARY